MLIGVGGGRVNWCWVLCVVVLVVFRSGRGNWCLAS